MATVVEIELTRGGGKETCRWVPVVVAGDSIEQTILRFLLHLAEEKQASSSTLHRYALALSRFHGYHEKFGAQESGRDLLSGFWAALRGRKPGIAWPETTLKTAKNQFQALNQFTDWLVTQPDVRALHPNPSVIQPLDWWTQLTAIEARQRTSLLPQLISRTHAGRGIRISREFEPYRSEQRRIGSESAVGKAPQKVMGLENLTKLIHFETSPRNLIIWLLLGGAGLRISEALQMFVSDVSYDHDQRVARVVLADPLYGAVYHNGTRYTRQGFLKEIYNLRPRELDKRSRRVGWKGIDIDSMRDRSTEAVFLFPDLFGKLFWNAHLKYAKERARIGSHHPYYLVNLRKSVGEPMTRSNISQILEASCEKLGITSATNPHSLRHTYGSTLKNEMGIPAQIVQRLMRHRHPSSTAIYTAPSQAAIRCALQNAEKSLREARSNLADLSLFNFPPDGA